MINQKLNDGKNLCVFPKIFSFSLRIHYQFTHYGKSLFLLSQVVFISTFLIFRECWIVLFVLDFAIQFILSCSSSGHILTEESEGETPMIPAEVMQYSIKQSTEIDLNTTLKVLASPSDSIETIPGASTHSDYVIR